MYEGFVYMDLHILGIRRFGLHGLILGVRRFGVHGLILGVRRFGVHELILGVRRFGVHGPILGVRRFGVHGLLKGHHGDHRTRDLQVNYRGYNRFLIRKKVKKIPPGFDPSIFSAPKKLFLNKNVKEISLMA